MQTICAYLMATEGLTPDQALASLREARRVACPNHGFLAQLALFHQMHCKCAPPLLLRPPLPGISCCMALLAWSLHYQGFKSMLFSSAGLLGAPPAARHQAAACSAGLGSHCTGCKCSYRSS
jgi:hypothetical protein